jgi:GNAT superfamily N-acetyltransferase
MRCETRVLVPDEWQVWRDIRLRSLADAPDAFGSTLEFEQTFGEDDWRGRLDSLAVVVEVDGAPVACGAAFVEEPGEARIVAMWVDPAHRGHGHSRRVLDVLVGWARDHGLSVEIGVNRANDVARAAYRSYGFVPAGHSHPLRDGSEQRCDVLVLPRRAG